MQEAVQRDQTRIDLAAEEGLAQDDHEVVMQAGLQAQDRLQRAHQGHCVVRSHVPHVLERLSHLRQARRFHTTFETRAHQNMSSRTQDGGGVP